MEVFNNNVLTTNNGEVKLFVSKTKTFKLSKVMLALAALSFGSMAYAADIGLVGDEDGDGVENAVDQAPKDADIQRVTVNHINNGDFEDGLTDWKKGGTKVTLSTADGFTQGSTAMFMEVTAKNQKVTVNNNVLLDMSTFVDANGNPGIEGVIVGFWYKMVTLGALPAKLRLVPTNESGATKFGANGSDVVLSSATEWTYVTKKITYKGNGNLHLHENGNYIGKLNAFLQLRNPGDKILVDNFTLYTIAEKDVIAGEQLIADNRKPTITLNGESTITVTKGGTYQELGATAFDFGGEDPVVPAEGEDPEVDLKLEGDGDISGNIVIDDSEVNLTTAGDYSVTYNIFDAAGNAAAQVTRTVTVTETDITKPVITLLGENPALHFIGENTDDYVDAGATGFDDLDGDISSSITVVSTVSNDETGSYTVTYSLTDAAGNITEVVRTVNAITSTDTDGDGVIDFFDLDDDNDGTPDFKTDNDGEFILDDDTGEKIIDDVFPLDAAESADTDGDGIGNNADLDDDNDTYPDFKTGNDGEFILDDNGDKIIDDVFPLDATEWLNNDGDVLGDNADDDDDNDFILDVNDTKPFDFDEPSSLPATLDSLTFPTQGRFTNLVDLLTVPDLTVYDDRINSVTLAVEQDVVRSGAHTVTWNVTLTTGEIGFATQVINLKPKVNLPLSAVIAPDLGTTSYDFSLNGKAPIYPVTVELQLTQLDASGVAFEIPQVALVSSTITLTQGQQASFDLNVLEMLDDTSSISIAATAVTGVDLGQNVTTEISIVSANIAPRASFSFNKTGDQLDVQVHIKDLNITDAHDVSLSLPADITGAASYVEQALGFSVALADLAGLTSTNFIISADITENNTDDLHSITISRLLNTAHLACVDTDKDGIVDSKDNSEEAHQLPLSNSGAITSSAGVTLSLGRTAKSAQGCTAATAVIAATDELTATQVLDKFGSALGGAIDDSVSADDGSNSSNSITNIIDFVGELPVTETQLSVVFPLGEGQIFRPRSVYRKFSETNGWANFVENSNNQVLSAPYLADGFNCPEVDGVNLDGSTVFTDGLTVGDGCIKLIIEDGGPNDADGQTNGIVEDPGYVTYLNVAPTVSLEWVDNGDTTFTVTAITGDADGDDLTITWTLNNEVYATGEQAVFTTPAANGDFNYFVWDVSVTVADPYSSAKADERWGRSLIAPQDDFKPSSGGASFWLVLLGLGIRMFRKKNIVKTSV